MQPFGHNRRASKIGAPREGELGPHLTQCGQGRGLPACQVSSWSVQPFGTMHQRYRQTGQTRFDSIGRTVLQTVAQKYCYRFHIAIFDEYLFDVLSKLKLWHRSFTISNPLLMILLYVLCSFCLHLLINLSNSFAVDMCAYFSRLSLRCIYSLKSTNMLQNSGALYGLTVSVPGKKYRCPVVCPVAFRPTGVSQPHSNVII